MKKTWKIILGVFAILLLGLLWFFMTPVDIRPDYLGDKIAEKEYPFMVLIS